MTQMPPPLDTPAATTVPAVKKSGVGKLAFIVTLVAAIALVTTVLEQFGHVMFSASLALWALGFLLTLAGLLPGRKKGWAFLSLLFNIALAGWVALSMSI
jgi:hypothetical protein